MTVKAVRAIISIAGVSAEVFQLPFSAYVLSQTQATGAINKPESSIRRFLKEKRLQVLSDNSPVSVQLAVEGSNKPVNVLPIEVVTDYWTEQAFKGNIKAQALVKACTQETLQRRCDNAFGVSNTESQYEQQSAINRYKWQETREYLKEKHNGFTLACMRYSFNPAIAHDKITIAVCGKTANQLREMDLIEGREDIGLDHIDNEAELRTIARVKHHFSRYRKGNIDERVNRAYNDATKDEKTLKVTTNN